MMSWAGVLLYLRENFLQLKEQLAERGLPENFEKWPELDKKRRALIAEAEALRAEKNSVNPKVAAAKKAGEDTTTLFDGR